MPRKAPRRTAIERAEEAEALTRIEVARAKRERAKIARKALATYRMAEKTRETADWRAPRSTADQAIVPDLPTMHARARQLVRDNPIAAAIVRAFVRNVVGRGVSPAASIELEEGEPDTAANRRLNWTWELWADDPSLVDVQGRRSWSDVLAWAVAELVAVGEAVIVADLVTAPSGDLVPQFQLWEAEQLSTRVLTHQGREVVGGVELDETGRPVAYWLEPAPVNLWTAVFAADPIRIEAERVIHVVDHERANQTRGVSRLTPVARAIRDLGEYDSAQLMAARAEACIGLVLESDGITSISDEAEEGEETPPPPDFEIPKMAVMRTLPGEKAVPFTPTRPGGQYEPFVRAQLRMIAAGVGLSYEQIARDFSQGSYSSARQAMLEDLREWARIRRILETTVCRRAWSLHVAAQVLRSTVLLPGYSGDPRRFERVTWAWDGHDWIDPGAEVAAHREAIDLGLDTRQRILAERGMSYEDVLSQWRREREDFAAPAPALPPAPAPEPAESPDGSAPPAPEEDDQDNEPAPAPAEVEA